MAAMDFADWLSTLDPAMVSIADVLSSACFALPHTVAGDYVSGRWSPSCFSCKRFSCSATCCSATNL